MLKNKSLKYRVKPACNKCDPLWGGLGLCKRHSPYHTIAHMGFWRWLWVGVVKSGKIVVVSVLPFIVKMVVAVAFAVLFLYALNTGIEKQELVTCIKLNSYSQTYSPHFFITETEQAMCDAHGVYIDAPVK